MPTASDCQCRRTDTFREDRIAELNEKFPAGTRVRVAGGFLTRSQFPQSVGMTPAAPPIEAIGTERVVARGGCSYFAGGYRVPTLASSLCMDARLQYLLFHPNDLTVIPSDEAPDADAYPIGAKVRIEYAGDRRTSFEGKIRYIVDPREAGYTKPSDCHEGLWMRNGERRVITAPNPNGTGSRTHFNARDVVVLDSNVETVTLPKAALARRLDAARDEGRREVQEAVARAAAQLVSGSWGRREVQEAVSGRAHRSGGGS